MFEAEAGCIRLDEAAEAVEGKSRHQVMGELMAVGIYPGVPG